MVFSTRRSGRKKPFPGSFCPIRATFGNSSRGNHETGTQSTDENSARCGIEDIELDLKSRDDIPALLLGLQHLYADAHFRSRLFCPPGRAHSSRHRQDRGARPGMEMWRILVMGVIKQGPGLRFRPSPRTGERAQDAAAGSLAMRMSGTIIATATRGWWTTWALLRPELLVEVNHLIVESGHGVAGKKKPGAPLAGR